MAILIGILLILLLNSFTLFSIEKKLSNEKFVNNAPEKVIEIENKKLKDAKEKIVYIENQIEALE